jgi:hypothetical protein
MASKHGYSPEKIYRVIKGMYWCRGTLHNLLVLCIEIIIENERQILLS